MEKPIENQVPQFREPVDFWRDQSNRLTAKLMDLRMELDEAENQSAKWSLAAIVFACLSIFLIGLRLL